MSKIRIGIVDDHQLFLKSLSLMLRSFQNYDVVIEALNGKNLQDKINMVRQLPEIILLDVNMPVMGGAETAQWLNEHYPQIKLVALSMNDDDKTIIEMVRAGCCAYLMKDAHPNELEKALKEIYEKGYYNGDAININYRRLLLLKKEEEMFKVTEKEMVFLKYACTDLTYKQIASKMNLSERTIDTYRESLFKKFNVASRVGLCMEAVRRKLVQL